MPTISVIVPVYKVEPYLRECIESILNQTFRDFELILVDDGSPDNCGKICDEYALKDSRIVVIHKENGGLSSARNAGLDFAFNNSNSTFVSFIDSDDLVHNLFLEHLFVAIQDSCEMSLCYYMSFSGDSNYQTPMLKFVDNNSYWNLINATNGLTVNSTCKLFKKAIFEDIRYPIGRLFEDSFVIHKIISKCSKISVVNEFLYLYRIVDTSISHSFDEKKGTIDSLACKLSRATFYFNLNDKQLFARSFDDCFDYLVSSFVKYRSDKELKSEIKNVYRSLKNIYKEKKFNVLHQKNKKTSLFFAFPKLYIFLKIIQNKSF